jgi:hypothetical protein
MRVRGLGLGLLIGASSAAAQSAATDSVRWTFGLGRGFGPYVSNSPYVSRENGSISLLSEWRRGASRIAGRAELLHAVDDSWSSRTPGPLTMQNGFTVNKSTATAFLLSGLWELRPRRALSPYAVLGAGVVRNDTRRKDYGPCEGGICPEDVEVRESQWRSLNAALVTGLGLSVSVRRLSLFGEYRGVMMNGVYNSGMDGFTVGARVRPE